MKNKNKSGCRSGEFTGPTPTSVQLAKEIELQERCQSNADIIS